VASAGDAERDRQASARLAELQNEVEKAAGLIAELRESNYSLNGEIVELKRQIESPSEEDPEPRPSEDTSELVAELEVLRKERAAIRARVVKLLERIEKLES